MTTDITLLVLSAALLHASWNAVLRAGTDRLWSMTVMCLAIAAICAALVFLVPTPARASWGYVLFSGLLHLGYTLVLLRTYRSGDLGQTYPIARGSSPLLVSLGAALFAGELPNLFGVAGVVLVSGGIMSLAFQGRRLSVETLPYALATGCFIGAYSVTDGIGSRLSGAPVGYAVWLCLVWGLIIPPVYFALRGFRRLVRGRRETCAAAGGGVVSLLAYGIIIFAMSRAPMGPVSALRETSVVFAAIIGRIFLHERLTAYRLAACAVIALGAACIGYVPELRKPETALSPGPNCVALSALHGHNPS